MTPGTFIERHEGRTLTAKPDVGNTVVIGVGRNLMRKGISMAEAELLLANDVSDCWAVLTKMFGAAVSSYGEPRQAALLDMIFELGAAGFAEFTQMVAAIRAGDWAVASACALDSAWAKQVPARAQEDAAILETGEWPAWAKL